MPDPNVLSLLANAGWAGLVLLLFLKGWLTAKPGTDRMSREVERWRKLYESEKSAHDLTRKAHAEETRAVLQSAAEGTQVAAALLTELKSRQGAS